ncbi:thioredoxin domain-containing protein 9-like [Mytilus californianus]|uniref:thioredoxin domain-containing protein 9-like n=1 Tax=Mytilus californianus TaxID=6549 RepID=UPI00224509CA|nr:thioredoxin domain-containing protein 9-like [Mytilus californianus]
MANAMIQDALQNQLTQAAQIMEQQVDAELHRLDNMDEDDFESLRRKRMEAMKKSQKQKQDWMTQGHGKYTEILDEKEFFEMCKKSKRVVCHFYRDSTFRCKIVDKHLEILAPKHMETKFAKINAEKCPFLVERLRIVVLPTMCVAKDGKTTDYIVGFDEMGGKDDFPTEMLEWRLGRADVINYSGDLLEPPSVASEKKTGILGHAKTSKTIRGRNDDDSSDEDDW